MKLKYGCNPHQRSASAEPVLSGRWPIELLNGNPSVINLLDALNGWQLVRELESALGLAAAASFKHVSPAGAAVAVPLDETLCKAYEVEGQTLSDAAVAVVRARGADPKSSFSDFVALSRPVDRSVADLLKGVVSDGIIAPDFDPDALETLRAKKQGAYIVFRADPDFEPPEREVRELFGLRIEQDRNNRPTTERDLDNVVTGTLDASARRDLVLGLVTVKYTQSNSVGYSVGGQMIGIGAGQQSRVDCTKIAGAKADVWQLGRHPKVLGMAFRPGSKRQERINWRVRVIEGDLTPREETELRALLLNDQALLSERERREWLSAVRGVSLVSDGFLPFRDNVDHARRHGVSTIAQPGGSSRDDEVTDACREHGITLIHTGVRAFHH